MQIPILNVDFVPQFGNSDHIVAVELIEKLGIAADKLEEARKRGVKKSRYEKEVGILMRKVEKLIK